MPPMTLGEALAILVHLITTEDGGRGPAEVAVAVQARAVVAEHYERLLKKFEP